MPRTLPLALLFALASATATAATTLCRHGETDYFSCTLHDGRQASVCGQVDTDSRHDDVPEGEWLQLRLGRPGALVLAWPKAHAGSTAAFEGNVFVRYDVSDLRFVMGDRLWNVSLAYGGAPDDAGGHIARHAELGWERADGANGSSPCRRIDVRRYARPFTDLNVTLHRRRPRSDLLDTWNQTDVRPAAAASAPRRSPPP